jgi:hypothetical protein
MILEERENPKPLLPAGHVPAAFGYYGGYFNQVPGQARPAGPRPAATTPAPVKR